MYYVHYLYCLQSSNKCIEISVVNIQFSLLVEKKGNVLKQRRQLPPCGIMRQDIKPHKGAAHDVGRICLNYQLQSS